MQQLNVTSSDGLFLSAQEWGNPTGREILFIHGFNQSNLSWSRQVAAPELAREFRMVTFDLRGHGASEKPPDKERYADNSAWGGDVAAVIAAAGLKRPVLVGWSYGGRVISDYLRNHGAARIAGINYAAAVTKSDSALLGSGTKFIPGMTSDDLATNISSTRGFLRACFERQPNADDFETMLAFNMVVPARVRAAVLGRESNPADMLSSLKLPVLVTHGDKDQVILLAMGQHTASTVPGARLSVYDGIGHAPFWEDRQRFNEELAAFVRAANGAG